MNILYIAPYRQKNQSGIASLCLLINLLNTKHKISARPIYIDGQPIQINDNKILESEKLVCAKYDVVIQYTKPEHAIQISSVNKNILIPILNENLLTEETVNALTKFDSILIDTKVGYHRLSSSSKISNKVKTYDYDLPIGSVEKNEFSLGVLNKTKKLYFIGKYSTNITNIQNICQSFIKNISNTEHSLVLFLFDIDQTTKNNIENMIQTMYSNFNVKYAINRIILAPIDCTVENLLIAHQTGDIFIDLQDDNSNMLNVKIAEALNKTIVSFSTEDYDYALNRNDKTHVSGCVGISIKVINDMIQKVLNNTFSNNKVPFKKQHLTKLI